MKDEEFDIAVSETVWADNKYYHRSVLNEESSGAR